MESRAHLNRRERTELAIMTLTNTKFPWYEDAIAQLDKVRANLKRNKQALPYTYLSTETQEIQEFRVSQCNNRLHARSMSLHELECLSEKCEVIEAERKFVFESKTKEFSQDLVNAYITNW